MVINEQHRVTLFFVDFLAGRYKPCASPRTSRLVRQLEADILTISRGNSILVLSCFFKVSKYISGCWPRWIFLWALANTFFVNITIKLYYCQIRRYFKFNLKINDLHHEKAHKKLNIRHLNGHLDIASGFQVIDPSNYEKVIKSRKNPGH